jgi:potassium channel
LSIFIFLIDDDDGVIEIYKSIGYQLPERLQEQMISHLSLKLRTDSEGLQELETMGVLPKAIRSSISHHLFFGLVQNVYLFQGVSNDLIFQLVITKPECQFHF